VGALRLLDGYVHPARCARYNAGVANYNDQDRSLQALSLLNELVSAAKVSSDIPNTQDIQIVP
jgi:hypothetical protein